MFLFRGFPPAVIIELERFSPTFSSFLSGDWLLFFSLSLPLVLERDSGASSLLQGAPVMRPLPIPSGATARSCPWQQSRAQTRASAGVAVAASTTTHASRDVDAAPLRASSAATAAQSPSPSLFRRARRREDVIVCRAAAASSRSDDGSNADSCAERGAGGDDLGGEGDEPLRNAALLSQLLAALDAGGAPSVASLTSRGAPCEGARSLRFMQWLSDREDEGEGGGGGGGGEGEGGEGG